MKNTFGIVVLILAFVPKVMSDPIVNAGWDLFVTDPATTSFMGVNWQGVPYTDFDFGGSIGVQNVGAADTIIYRENNVVNGINNSTAIDMVGWQLRTVNQVNLGAGSGYYYLTLQSGQSSGGTMSDITFAGNDSLHGGTFDSSLDVFFDLRFGALDATPITSGDCILNSSGNMWGNTAPLGVPAYALLPDVNFMLNGTDTTEDFWTQNEVVHANPDNSIVHSVDSVPEPSPLGLAAIGLAGLAFFRRFAAGNNPRRLQAEKHSR